MIIYLSPRPEARFTVAYGIRPVGNMVGRLVQVTICELNQQAVAPPFAVEET